MKALPERVFHENRRKYASVITSAEGKETTRAVVLSIQSHLAPLTHIILTDINIPHAVSHKAVLITPL